MSKLRVANKIVFELCGEFFTATEPEWGDKSPQNWRVVHYGYAPMIQPCPIHEAWLSAAGDVIARSYPERLPLHPDDQKLIEAAVAAGFEHGAQTRDTSGRLSSVKLTRDACGFNGRVVDGAKMKITPENKTFDKIYAIAATKGDGTHEIMGMTVTVERNASYNDGMWADDGFWADSAYNMKWHVRVTPIDVTPPAPAPEVVFVNATPHDITIVNEGGESIAIPATRKHDPDICADLVWMIRADAQTAAMPPVGGIAVSRKSFGEVYAGWFEYDPAKRDFVLVEREEVPEPKPGTVFIVSGIVLSRCIGRSDVFAPGEAIRDTDGKILGCKGLSAAPLS